jgi:hypothetical protein
MLLMPDDCMVELSRRIRSRSTAIVLRSFRQRLGHPGEYAEITSDYQWEIGEHSTGEVPITYLIGYARVSSREFIQ